MDHRDTQNFSFPTNCHIHNARTGAAFHRPTGWPRTSIHHGLAMFPPRSSYPPTGRVLICDSGTVLPVPGWILWSPIRDHPYRPHPAGCCEEHQEEEMMRKINLATEFPEAFPLGPWGRVQPTPGWECELHKDDVNDGTPQHGKTTFDFRISYPRDMRGGMCGNDGHLICDTVDWVVRNMIADRTFRRAEDGEVSKAPWPAEVSGAGQANDGQEQEQEDDELEEDYADETLLPPRCTVSGPDSADSTETSQEDRSDP